MTTVRFEPEADEEYRASAAWYNAKRVGLGSEFLDSVDATITQIRHFPRSGAVIALALPGLAVRRAPVPRFPFYVVYIEIEEGIRILAIAHDSRSPGYWKTRIAT